MQVSENQLFTKRVLVISRQELQLASILNFLYESHYDSIGVLQNDEALRFFDEHDPHIFIISSTVDNESKQFLIQHFQKIKPDLTVLELSGGVSALKLLLENYVKRV